MLRSVWRAAPKILLDENMAEPLVGALEKALRQVAGIRNKHSFTLPSRRHSNAPRALQDEAGLSVNCAANFQGG